MSKPRKLSLMEMFSAFPQFMAQGAAEIAMTAASYLEITARFPDEIISDACLSFRKRSTPFPPSSGEFFAQCERLNADRVEALRFKELKSLPAPVEQYSDEHRESMKARFQQLVDDLKSGKLRSPSNGFSDAQLADENCIVNRIGLQPYTMRPGKPYGYMTPAELSLPSVAMPVTRTVPPSWREKYERERRYAGRDRYPHQAAE